MGTRSKEVITMSHTVKLLCHPWSDPFEDRTLILDEPVKIGRAVARLQPCTTNAIFNSKVLSKKHASLWYESGKFFLKDTKSSNGTFVNSVRLSSSEASPPKELVSGDVIQFGVDVLEGLAKHLCVKATIITSSESRLQRNLSPIYLDPRSGTTCESTMIQDLLEQDFQKLKISASECTLPRKLEVDEDLVQTFRGNVVQNLFEESFMTPILYHPGIAREGGQPICKRKIDELKFARREMRTRYTRMHTARADVTCKVPWLLKQNYLLRDVEASCSVASVAIMTPLRGFPSAILPESQCRALGRRRVMSNFAALDLYWDSHCRRVLVCGAHLISNIAYFLTGGLLKENLLLYGEQFLECELMMLQNLVSCSQDLSRCHWKRFPYDLLRQELFLLRDCHHDIFQPFVNKSLQEIRHRTLDAIRTLQVLGHLYNEAPEPMSVPPISSKRPVGGFFLIFGDDPNAEVETFLSCDGHCKLDYNNLHSVQSVQNGYPLWIFVNIAMLSEIHQLPDLLHLKHFPSSSFCTFEIPQQIPLRKCNDIFASGGIIIPDGKSLLSTPPSALLHILHLLRKKRELEGQWRMLVHKHILQTLKEVRQNHESKDKPEEEYNPEAVQALSILKILFSHRKGQPLKFLPHHSCDTEECLQLSCARTAQKRHYRTHRHIIIVSDAEPDTMNCYVENGVCVVTMMELITKYLL